MWEDIAIREDRVFKITSKVTAYTFRGVSLPQAMQRVKTVDT